MFSQHYFDALLANLEVRLVENLCRLATGENMDMSISHDDLAKFVGASRQSVSTILKGWERARLIRLGYGVLQVRDLTSFGGASIFTPKGDRVRHPTME